MTDNPRKTFLAKLPGQHHLSEIELLKSTAGNESVPEMILIKAKGSLIDAGSWWLKQEVELFPVPNAEKDKE